MAMDVKATDQCRNCGDEFANHKYIAGTMDQYRCPLLQQECGYGFFCGGDPRDFHPDGECSTPEEIANHRRSCELWDAAEQRGEMPEPEKCPSGWIYDDAGKALMHVLRAPYGLGTYVTEFETFFEPLEHDYEDEGDE